MKNKYLIIPDLHGKDVWLNAIQTIKHHNAIFLGDYFDYGKSIDSEIKNFYDILLLKKENKDAIELLLGNHEYHYLNVVNQKYTGFSGPKKELISGLLKELIDKSWLKIAHAIDDTTLAVHAGISIGFSIEQKIPLDLNAFELAQELNELFVANPLAFSLKENHFSGNSVFASPIWIRPESLLDNAYPGLFQIVGHTQHESLSVVDNIAFCDCLNFNSEMFLSVTQGDSKPILNQKK